MYFLSLCWQVTYSLITDTPYFTLDSASGMIIVKGILDRETKDRHVLEIKASDMPGKTYIS